MRNIVNRINKGFSLIELFAVILAIAALAAMALPSYRSYIARARLVEVISILESHLNEAKKEYIRTGAVPTSVLGIPNRVNTAYTDSKYIAYIYYDNGSLWTNTNAAMVKAIVSANVGNGIDGFVAGTSGAHNTVALAFALEGDQLAFYCGSWVVDGSEIPLEYLPKGCQDTDINNLI